MKADAFARAARPLAERGGGHNDLADVSGVAFVGARRPHAKPEARPEGINRDADGPSTTAAAPPMPPPPAVPAQASRRTSTRYFKLPDAIAEKGDGACSPTEPDCGATALRHPASGAGDMRRAIKVARELFATSAWGAEKVAGGRPTTLRRTRGQPNKEVSRAAFSMATDEVAPPTRPQDGQDAAAHVAN
ncbi:hypothetical protein TcYC6_0077450 [Trypanosoma cruzi]|nr:hypothetical protein TcYC6_0077450 [Trypanosoma cruzi]